MINLYIRFPFKVKPLSLSYMLLSFLTSYAQGPGLFSRENWGLFSPYSKFSKLVQFKSVVLVKIIITKRFYIICCWRRWITPCFVHQSAPATNSKRSWFIWKVWKVVHTFWAISYVQTLETSYPLKTYRNFKIIIITWNSS